MSTTTPTLTPTSQLQGGERALGRIKWFNSKSGFGFVTVTDGTHKGRDIFVHHSAIGVLSQQYKYLVEGEYIELFVLPTESGGAHEFQAANVCGVNGGKLMCETRNENKKPPSSSLEQQKDWTIVSKIQSVEGRPVGGGGRGRGRGRGRGGGGRTSTK
jgi:cold shock CspA family protein